MIKVKDLIGIALISICVFPVTLIAFLFAMNVIHLDVGLNEQAKEKTNQYLRKYHPRQDEAEANNLKSLQAMRNQEKILEERKVQINRDIERLENLKLENGRIKDDIIKNRDKIEKLVASSGAIKEKRMKALAEVYGSMRPEEAAPILLTLDNKMVAEILSLIPEVRSKSKLMGAIGTIDVNRAAKISKIMGENKKG